MTTRKPTKTENLARLYEASRNDRELSFLVNVIQTSSSRQALRLGTVRALVDAGHSVRVQSMSMDWINLNGSAFSWRTLDDLDVALRAARVLDEASTWNVELALCRDCKGSGAQFLGAKDCCRACGGCGRDLEAAQSEIWEQKRAEAERAPECSCSRGGAAWSCECRAVRS